MLADDAFRSRRQSTIAELRYWLPTISDAASIDDEETDGYWKVRVQPGAGAGACPFELMIRADQRYDLAVAGRIFEDIEISSFDVFRPLIEAISAGHVIVTSWESPLTGRTVAEEVIVPLGGGRIWRSGTVEPAGIADRAAAGDGEPIRRDRHFLPYRR